MTNCYDYDELSFVFIYICNNRFSSQTHTVPVLDLIVASRTAIHVSKALYVSFYSTNLQDYHVSKMT